MGYVLACSGWAINDGSYPGSVLGSVLSGCSGVQLLHSMQQLPAKAGSAWLGGIGGLLSMPASGLLDGLRRGARVFWVCSKALELSTGGKYPSEILLGDLE